MTNWLVKKFVRNSDDWMNEQVRFSYGKLSSYTGIVCNVFLFILKYTIGLISGSIAITSDAFNNISDCMSCIITLFGYRLAAKPADREHPFGHGRMEYVISFIVAVLIFIVGFELVRSSIDSLLHPTELEFNWVLFVVLVSSIGIKIWMSVFNRTLGTRLNHTTLLATADDSRNDVLATSVTVVALLLSHFFPTIPFDGIGGIFVSCFILYSGYGIAKEIIDKLLGGPADAQLVKSIQEQILSHPEVIGVHDMIINDYGPGVKIGSAHAEVDSSMDFLKAHDIIDTAEKEIGDSLHVMMTLHLDPVDLRNPKTAQYRTQTVDLLHQLDPQLSLHDFRVVYGDTHNNLIFDVVIPFGLQMKPAEIQAYINQGLNQGSAVQIFTVIQFDRDFNSGAE